MIDDERRTHGDMPLRDSHGNAISAQQIEMLYDKMGDGTMLVSDVTMQALQTTEERDKIALKAAERSGVSGDISTLAQELFQADTSAALVERQERALAHRSVFQFRAASPDLPGIAKGTMASSRWCERLGVDAIISRNDIKGDDGRLSTPGIKAVSNFWINRKATGQYGQQSVGPQVKYTIPEATRLEINPKVQAQAEELAQVAGDFAALSQRYVEQTERERSRPYQDLEDESLKVTRPDWLYDTLSADKYGQLTEQATVVKGLSRYVRGEWLKLSTNGTSVPSAMAQHHSQLKPWEVCNKDLPHGAIVTYYRSPFPNVGAAVIAINNTEVLREQDREAFSKQGVAYLPPWTAKNVAITDFDGDMNGFFVGYQATMPDLPQQIRAELLSVQRLPLDQQYEAGRALFEQMIQQLGQGQERRLVPDEHPLVVKEFTERNAPDVRPPEIVKQQKEKHPWQAGESRSAATWRAWEITADNPVGKVANAGMSLQALALELRYAPVEQKEALLHQVSGHFSKLLEKVDAGKVAIPDDDWLTSQGFSPFYREQIEEIAGASSEVVMYQESKQRCKATEIYWQRVSAFLSDVASGPNAVNLQTAADMAKSAKGIDQALHDFVKALQYKRDIFRQSKKNPDIYVGDKAMPTNTEEPIAWGIQSVNVHYHDAQLEERPHLEFQALFPLTNTKPQARQAKAVIQNYNGLVRTAIQSKARLRQRRPEDQKPTLQVLLPDGRQFSLQNIQDAQGKLPIWRAEGTQPKWAIRIKQDFKASQKARFPAQLIFVDSNGAVQAERVGYVSPASAIQHNLATRLPHPDQKLTVSSPHVTCQVPWAQQHDTDRLFETANRYLESALAPPVGKEPERHRQAMAIALWRQANGRHIVLKQFPGLVSDRLRQVPVITLSSLKYAGVSASELIAGSPYTIQFSTNTFQDRKGVAHTKRSISVFQSVGELKHIGLIDDRNVGLPTGSIYMASFSRNVKSDLAVDMQVMDLPTVEQSPAEITAFPGRSHLTFDHEPYAAYGVREGDIIIAQSESGGESVALQVKGQYRIDETLATTSAQRWSEVEKLPPAILFEKLAVARGEGQDLWGLNVQPLGAYAQGQITPFPVSQLSQAMTRNTEKVLVNQPPQERPASLQLWERYSHQNSGVMSGIASGNSQLQQALDRTMAERAMGDGFSVQSVREAISRHSPQAQQSGQPEAYAESIVSAATNVISPSCPPARRRETPLSPDRRPRSKDRGFGL